MNRGMMTLAMLVSAAPAWVLSQEAVKAEGGLKFDGGADLRFRDELKHEEPGTGVTAKKAENVLRLRTRVWGSASYEDYTLYARLADEFRVYTVRPGKKRDGMATYDFPEEVFFNDLYFDAKNLFQERIDLRVGRQELKYGESRIFSDGTPSDGSRSTYFNAAVATMRVTEKTSLDALGIYMPAYDEMAVGPYDRPLETLNSTCTDNEEAGGGLYLKVGEVSALPFELYYVWKNESHSHNVGARKYGRDFHTFGTRLMPKFSDRWSAEAELAAQTGETDDGREIFAYMGYGGLTCALAPDTAFKPYVTPAVLYLSGDDRPNSGDDNNWNPVFNRATWFSILLSDQYKNYQWANLVFPHLAGGVSLPKERKLKMYTGPVFCVEDDQMSNGDGDTYKGYMTYARYEAPLAKGLFGKRAELCHAVQLEAFEPGGYYETEATGVFLRWEVNARF